MRCFTALILLSLAAAVAGQSLSQPPTPTATVVVQVRGGTSGKPMAGVTVQLVPSGSQRVITEGVSNSEGLCRLEEIALPRHERRLRGEVIARGAPHRPAPVFLNIPDQVETVELLVADPLTVAGVVVDADTGEPIPGFDLTLWSLDPDHSDSGRTDSEGRFRLRVYPSLHVDDARLEFSIVAETNGRQFMSNSQALTGMAESFVIDAREGEIIEVRQVDPASRDPRGTLRLGLIGPEGDPVAHTAVTVCDPRAGISPNLPHPRNLAQTRTGRWGLRRETSEAGTVRFPDLSLGRCFVTFAIGSAEQQTTLSREVVIDPGNNEISVDLSGWVNVTGRLVQGTYPIEGASVQVRGLASTAVSGFTPATEITTGQGGMFTVVMPPGRCEFTVAGVRDPIRATVAEGREVVVDIDDAGP
ncbi:hypothetical protein JXA47_16765 [Candidatus Sumerlaeota bacterium]|nr:hypothetical protein [Candidatus Sumerlaeota bacterium]